MNFSIFRCRRCGRYLYARKTIKTRKCVCGYINRLNRVMVVAVAENEQIAAEIVRRKQGAGTGFARLG